MLDLDAADAARPPAGDLRLDRRAPAKPAHRSWTWVRERAPGRFGAGAYLPERQRRGRGPVRVHARATLADMVQARGWATASRRCRRTWTSSGRNCRTSIWSGRHPRCTTCSDPAKVFEPDRTTRCPPTELLVVVEMDALPRYLPQDLGFGNPGLEERCHRRSPRPAGTPTRTGHSRWSLPGCVVSTKEPSTIAGRRPRLPGPHRPPFLTRMRSGLSDQLSAEDLAALDDLLDLDRGPAGWPAEATCPCAEPHGLGRTRLGRGYLPPGYAPRLTSAVVATAAVRPGAPWNCQ